MLGNGWDQMTSEWIKESDPRVGDTVQFEKEQEGLNGSLQKRCILKLIQRRRIEWNVPHPKSLLQGLCDPLEVFPFVTTQSRICMYRQFVVCINYIKCSKRYEINSGYLLSGFPSSFLLLPCLLLSLFPKQLSFLSVIQSSVLTSESWDFRCIPSCLPVTRANLFVIWFYLDRISFLRSDQPPACCNPVSSGSLVALEIQTGILTTGDLEA